MKKLILMLGIAGMIAGCCKRSQEEIMDAQMDVAIEYLSHPETDCGTNEYHVANAVLDENAKLTNGTDRAQCLEKYAQRLMAIDLSASSYYHQNRIYDYVCNVIWWRCSNGLIACEAGLGRACRLKWELIKWMEGQLDRIRPKRCTGGVLGPNDSSDELLEWRAFYHNLYVFWRICAYDFENPKRWAVVFGQRADKKEIRKHVESLLGRPLRTEKELRELSNYESADFKKVKSGYAP